MFNPLSLIGGLGLGSKIAIGMGLLLLATVSASAWYFNYSQNKLAEANQEVAAQKAKAASAEANLESLKNDVQEQSRQLAKLAEEMAENRKASQKLQDTLANHDLNSLVAAKPDLVEKRVNDGTAAVLKKLEDITDPKSYDVAPPAKDKKQK